MRVLFGIGNPGPDYRQTRHNLGFLAIETIAARASARLVPFLGLEAEGARVRLGSQRLLLVRPLTYVNRCGPVLEAIRRRLRLPLERLLVIVDDLNLPLGRLRLRAGGGDGGHRGLRSLLLQLGSSAVPRLRIGIGSPGALAAEAFVLQRFAPDEMPAVQVAMRRAAAAARLWVARGVVFAAERVNRRDLDQETGGA